MPADLKRLQKYMLEIEHISVNPAVQQAPAVFGGALL
jgi:hypothetical protein